MRGDYDQQLHEAIDELQAMRRRDRAERVERVLTLAREGRSSLEISRRLRVSVGFVWGELRRAGIPTGRKELPLGVPVPGL